MLLPVFFVHRLCFASRKQPSQQLQNVDPLYITLVQRRMSWPPPNSTGRCCNSLLHSLNTFSIVDYDSTIYGPFANQVVSIHILTFGTLYKIRFPVSFWKSAAFLHQLQRLLLQYFCSNYRKYNFLHYHLLTRFYLCSYSPTSEPFPLCKETPIASKNITFMNVLSILSFSNSNNKNCILKFETAKKHSSNLTHL
jgi:hypothetical protein